MKIELISSSTLPGQVRENGKSNPKSQTFTLPFPSLVTKYFSNFTDTNLDTWARDFEVQYLQISFDTSGLVWARPVKT